MPDGVLFGSSRAHKAIRKEIRESNLYFANDLKNYRKKVSRYLKQHENNIAIYKLKNNIKLAKKSLCVFTEAFLTILTL